MNDLRAIIVLPRIEVSNANAVSGPFTWGFPSPTAFTGFAHALQRRLSDTLENGFGSVGIVCHKFDPQVTRPAGKRTRVFNLTRNPLNSKGETAAIVEEGRAHMELSLVLTVHERVDADERDEFAAKVMEQAHCLRLAGGTILPRRQGKRYEAEFIPLSPSRAEQDEAFLRLRRRMLPGFALVQREDRLAGHLEKLREATPEANVLDALLDLARLNFEPDLPSADDPEEKGWGIRRREGWLVPLPVGYAAISPLYSPGEVRNSRDSETPFRFVESLYSLGEWVSPHRLNSLRQLLWQQSDDIEKGIYLCTNRYTENLTETNTSNS